MIALKDETNASKDKELVLKDKYIASLKAELNSPQKLLDKLLANKDIKIALLKSSLANSKPIVDIVDLTSEETEREKKRPRTISQIIVQEQRERMLQVKLEKSAAEASLKSVAEEKQVLEADLGDIREDLDIANDIVT